MVGIERQNSGKGHRGETTAADAADSDEKILVWCGLMRYDMICCMCVCVYVYVPMHSLNSSRSSVGVGNVLVAVVRLG